ncbi:MAG: M20/M25/M40 family metallo-hydrolase [Ruminococcaceae bacterium]|nr:M20/M25/M40 family metallo-hydrolase [Oscillospiraceae bacterium]
MKNKKAIGVTAAIAALAGINAVRAAVYKPAKRNVAQYVPESVDLDRFRKNLSDAVKIPTIAEKDPADMNWGPFDEFHAFLKERYPLIHEHLALEEPVRGSLLYRWKGKRDDLDPIALLAHQDVVPISDGTLQDWTYAPFDGVDDGEFIWGRGTLDMKNHLIGLMESVEALLADGFEPIRDVYLCLGHNEEVMSSEYSGAVVMCQYFKERGIHLDCIIDEGGAILPVHVKGVIDAQLAGIGVAEKGYADVEVSISAKGGHSSQPPKHSAIGELAGVIQDIENHQFKEELSPMMMELFDSVGRRMTYPMRLVMCNLPLLKPVIQKVMTLIPPAASLVRTTTGVTMASGSPAPNVLPQKASVNVNFRMYPGQTIEDVEKHLRQVIKNKKAEIMVKTGWKNPSAISPTDSRCFNALRDICSQMNPKSIIAPYLVMGGTDACHYEDVCENIYRYSPFLVDTQLLLCTHGTNERVPVAALADAVRFFKMYIRTLSAE